MKNIKLWDWVVWNQRFKWKIIEYFMSSKKIFFKCIYKIYLISAEGYKNAGVHFLKVKKTVEIWASMRDVQDGIGVKNMPDLILKEIYGIY